MRPDILNKHTSSRAVLQNFWLLVPALTPETRDGFMRSGDVSLCSAALAAHRAQDTSSLDRAMRGLSDRPVAIEWGDSDEDGVDRRVFRLPNDATMSIRELSFERGGFGGAVWDSGVAMSIFVSLGAGRAAVRGKRVLELGSGSGLGGISAALAGADSVVLSDYATKGKSSRLQANLLRNARDSNVGSGDGGSASAEVLDWNDCMRPEYVPSSRYPVVLGADVIYYEHLAAPLAAAIIAHTAEGGDCYLMNRVGRPGLDSLLARLGEAGELQTTDYTIVNNFDSTQLRLAIWRSPS